MLIGPVDVDLCWILGYPGYPTGTDIILSTASRAKTIFVDTKLILLGGPK